MNYHAITMNPSPPLGLAFIAGAIQKLTSHSINVIDSIAESPYQYNHIDFKLNIKQRIPKGAEFVTNGLSTNEIIARVSKDTKVIGLSCMFTNNWLGDRQLIQELGEAFPDAVIIAGGESITALPEFWLSQSKHLKVCVLGEGEETIIELLSAIENNDNLSKVQGVTYRDDDKIITTPRRKRIRELEEIPPPAWDLFPVESYNENDVKWGVTERKSLPLMATRGCPYDCTFCSSPQMWGRKYSMRTPKHVADEMEELMKKFGITNFDFYDLTAIIRKEWIIEFAKEIQTRNLDVTWQIPAGTRSEAIDAEVAKALYNSCCRNITYAPEFGSNRMLKLIRKRVDLKNMLISMGYSNKEGINIHINIILGLLGEKDFDVWKTVIFLIRCSWAGVNDIGLSLFQPYPGCEQFNELLEKRGNRFKC